MNPYCKCTFGLVVGLALSNNQVDTESAGDPAVNNCVTDDLFSSTHMLTLQTYTQLTGRWLEGLGPSSFACSLLALDLQGNSLSGSISPSIVNLTRLGLLNLASNKITGE